MKMTRWKCFLRLAHWFERTDHGTAESYFRSALQFAENECGTGSLAVGSVLADFTEFLERIGRNEEAEKYNGEVRMILVTFVQAHMV